MRMKLSFAMALAVALLGMSSKAQPVAQWATTSHDFGVFPESMGDRTFSFVINNTGDSSLVVLRVQSSCGCTVVKRPTQPIEPGAQATIDVTYVPTGRPGPFEKTVWVYTNSVPRRTALSIKGSVVGSPESVKQYFPVPAGDLQFTSLIMAAGELKKGQIHNSVITAYNSGSDTLVVGGFDNNTSHITCYAIPDTVPPGGITTMSFFFDSTRTPVWGINDNTVTILVSKLHGNGETTKINANLVANVVEDFTKLTDEQLAKCPVCTVEPGRIVMGTIDKGTVAQQSFSIVNNGKSGLIVRRVMSLDKAITARCDKTLIKPGDNARVVINIDTGKVTDKVLNSQVTLITNDPANPHIVVRVVGELK